MSENWIAPSGSQPDRVGGSLPLQSLAPRFDPEQHQLYLDLLKRALQHDQTRNIALTGAYGTGKSSVIAELVREPPEDPPATRVGRIRQRFHELFFARPQRRSVRLSLSTIDPTLADKDNIRDSSEFDRANRIQKEIVKQLLYRLAPPAVPRSQFHRASVTNTKIEWITASLIGAAGFAVLTLLGFTTWFVGLLQVPTWQRAVAYPIVLGLIVCVTWLVQKLIRGRPNVSASVATGPAKITLSPQSSSYFDEYLDEIVYFFQVSGCELVIVEDIDRFEAAHIFDTLRALNGLLNEADQIPQRVVFLYAVRDSVFERIGSHAPGTRAGKDSAGDPADTAERAVERASRTKFFDVVIPIVPFVNTENARDLLSAQMRSDDFTIEPTLIRLAARHVADMRMMRNIRNEFEVFRARLLEHKDHLPDITADLIFAIILFKNTHLADFERIQHKQSSLDNLYDVWRRIVQQNIVKLGTERSALRRANDAAALNQTRAQRLGEQLEQFRDDLAEALRVGTPGATLDFDGPLTADTLHDADAWQTLATESEQRLILSGSGRSNARTPVQLTFSTEQLQRILGVELGEGGWVVPEEREGSELLHSVESTLSFLRHHTWQELTARTDITFDPSVLPDEHPLVAAADPITFDDAVELLLPSRLAKDLVRGGFLTSHFALYAASFYGEHLSYDALEYIRRSIEPGVPDFAFTLSEQDVQQVLREQGAAAKDDADLFSDPSILNISILDYLLRHRLGAAINVARQLNRGDSQRRDFLDVYATQGDAPDVLLGLLARDWPGALTYAATSGELPEERRLAAVDAVLRSASPSTVDRSDDVGAFITSHYASLSAVIDPTSSEDATRIAAVLQHAGAQITSLDEVSGIARDAYVSARLFPINVDNVQALVGPEEPIGLDMIAPIGDAYAYVLDELPRFIAMRREAPDRVVVVSNTDRFNAVLADAAVAEGRRALGDLIASAPANAHVSNLTDVTAAAWPHLVTEERTDPSAANVAAYVEQYGVDARIGKFLTARRRVTDWAATEQEVRDDLAVTVLAARDAMPAAARVSVVTSLRPNPIAVELLTAEAGDLFARLLKAKLVADDADVFTADLLPDWPTLEQTIAASKRFAAFMAPTMIPTAFLANAFRSDLILNDVRKRVLGDLLLFLADASRPEARRLATAVADANWRLPADKIEAFYAHGATHGDLMRLLALSGEMTDREELKDLLRKLGDRYRPIADGGRGNSKDLPADGAHRAVLERLRGDTVKNVKDRISRRRGARLVPTLM